MKKTVQIVTIPLNKEGFSYGDILQSEGIPSLFVFAYNDHKDWRVCGWMPQQLLVLSDDEIQVGDWYLFDNVYVRKDGGYVEDKNHRYKKIIASYPQLEGTLPISKETVQAWIDSGTPGEGTIKLHGVDLIGDNSDQAEVITLDPQGNLLLEFGNKSAEEKPSIPTDYEILKKSLEHSDNLYNADDKSKDYLLSEHQLWENSLRDYEAGYKQALKDLGHE